MPRLDLYRDIVPDAGFDTWKSWGESMHHGYTVFNSNVDGQFQNAGFDARDVREYHASIHHLQCLAGCSRNVWSAEALQPVTDDAACKLLYELPNCPRCGGLARPNVLMFRDREWSDQRAVAQDYRQESWLRDITNPVVVEIGAGVAIPSVRHFSQRMIYEFDARLVRINPTDSQMPRDCDVGLPLSAHAAIKAIDERLNSVNR